MQFTYEREFTYNRAYRGPIKMVVLDWAGTTMDFGFGYSTNANWIAACWERWGVRH